MSETYLLKYSSSAQVLIVPSTYQFPEKTEAAFPPEIMTDQYSMETLII
jgi:hypothetical protein